MDKFMDYDITSAKIEELASADNLNSALSMLTSI